MCVCEGERRRGEDMQYICEFGCACVTGLVNEQGEEGVSECECVCVCLYE